MRFSVAGQHNGIPLTSAWGGYIADGGEKNSPFLLEKLRTEESEPVRSFIIFVFKLMSESGDLRGRHDVATQVDQAVSKLIIPFLKEEGQESLEQIKKSL